MIFITYLRSRHVHKDVKGGQDLVGSKHYLSAVGYHCL